MAQSALEMAKELVSAQITAGGISPEDTSALLTETYEHLLSLHSRENPSTQSNTYQTRPRITDWKQSIAKNVVICLECGASSRQLDIRHLRQHDLDRRSYRQKYGIPRTQPLAAKESTARRRKIIQQTRPWEKAPKYMERQESAVAGATKKKASAKRKRSAR